MASVTERRLRKLEERLDAYAAHVAAAEAAAAQRELELLFGQLGTDDLHAILAVVERVLETFPEEVIRVAEATCAGGGDFADTLRDLREHADESGDERGRRALDAALAALAHLRRTADDCELPRGDRRS